MRSTLIIMLVLGSAVAAAGVASADHHLPQVYVGKLYYNLVPSGEKHPGVWGPDAGVTWGHLTVYSSGATVGLHVEPVIPESGDEERLAVNGPSGSAFYGGSGVAFDNPIIALSGVGGSSGSAGGGFVTFEDPLLGIWGNGNIGLAGDGVSWSTPPVLLP